MDAGFLRLPGVCLRCGAPKAVALDRCGGCGHQPLDGDDRARHVAVLELDAEDRERLGARVARGEPASLAPEAVQAARTALDAATPVRVAAFALVVGGAPVVVVVCGLGVVAWLLLAL